MKNFLHKSAIFLGVVFFSTQSYCASFTISDGQSVTSRQDLDSDNETGTIEQGGTLALTGDFAIVGDGSTGLEITNNGEVSSNTDAILIQNSQNPNLINNGEISSSGSYGIYGSFNDGFEITNDGEISSPGLDAIYIEESQNTTITNNGTILATGSSNDAIFTEESDNTTIINNATITTQNGDAISSEGDNATITNNGAITTSSTNSEGIKSDGDNATIVNNGTISTSSQAIKAEGQNLNITNNGRITAQEHSSDGIELLNSNANSTIINNGTITVSGVSADGIEKRSGDGLTIINNGTISITGDKGVGVSMEGDATLTNNGTISATGDATIAIMGDEDDQIVILGQNSRIIGSIDLGQGQDSLTINLAKNGASQRIVVENIEEINVNSNSNFLIQDTVTQTNEPSAEVTLSSSGPSQKSIHFVDPTSVSAFNLGVNNLSLSINDAINSRLEQGNSEKSTSWNKIFGSKFERGQQGQNLGFNHDYQGFVTGYEKSKTGFVLGVSSAKIKTQTTSFQTDITSIFAGVYKNFEVAKLTTISLNLIGGYEKYEKKRQVNDSVNGAQIASSDFDNFFFSPSIAIQHRIKFGELFELVPNANLNYTASFFDSYSESGSSSNFNFDKRRAQIFNARAGVNGAFEILPNVKAQLGLGLNSRFISESKAQISIGNSSTKFDPQNDGSINGRYINFSLIALETNGLSLSAKIESRRASNQETQRSGHLNASYKF